MNTTNGEGGRFIEVGQAVGMARRFRQGKGDVTKAELFSRAQLMELLEGADGLRIYYGADDNGRGQLLLVSVDKEKRDRLPATAGGGKDMPGGEPTGKVLAFGQPCPNVCDSTSALF
ncbi:hypothetical protein GCM10023189_15150 [Nibrella saemangeumensis]|uniref:Uncharacterized protein n=1 Tax=Nibrella saemangeumensis TaxID=1084526 RepID=A0ABP8MP29_9BACT